MIREVNVAFEHYISGCEVPLYDETQFDIAFDQSPEDVFNEIVALANDFFDENKFHEARILGVEFGEEVFDE